MQRRIPMYPHQPNNKIQRTEKFTLFIDNGSINKNGIYLKTRSYKETFIGVAHTWH